MDSATRQPDRIYLSLIVLLAFFIPLHLRIVVLGTIILMGYALFTHFRAGRFRPVISRGVILFGGFYLLHLLGLIYTTNLVEGGQDVETKLTLLLFPLLFFSFPPLQEKAREQIFTSFVLGSLLSILLCLILAGVEYSSTGKNTFHYYHLSEHLGYHPAYLGMYLSFSLFLVISYCLKNRKTLSLPKQILLASLACFFLLMVMVLSSRMVIIATLLVLAIAFWWWMYQQGKLWKGLGISLLAMIILGSLIWSLPKTRYRMEQMINSFTQQEATTTDSQPNIRIQIWSAGINLWKQAPLLGYGTGDIQDNLMQAYQKAKLERAIKSNFNVHNQYLQTTIGLGLIGGLWLIASLLLPLWWARQDGDAIYAIFLGLMIIAMLTESMIEKEQGVLYYAFFNSLLASTLVRKSRK